MLKPLLAVALAAAPSSASVADVPAYPMVERVQCREGSGTAFIAGGYTISAAHVTTLSNCQMRGQPIALDNQGGDFSVGPARVRGYKIDCGGFKHGETYHAVGYAFGLYTQTVLSMTGTGKYADNGMALLIGWPTFIPGMSGGILLNKRGEAVGVVNMFSRLYPVSLSAELKGTSVCRNSGLR
jgi:hypothetical protein